ncbi:hypothetical protein SNE40_012894 [Patella caerulea]|uniref:Uncharacterized protein n=1 Tax=Patella caerulea TaxID=87958 RepID=A0AAN8JQE6_PATCE
MHRGGTFLESGDMPVYTYATSSFNDIPTTALNSPTRTVSKNDIDNFTGFQATSMYSGVKSVRSGGTSMRKGGTSMDTNASSSFGDLATSTKTVIAVVNSLILPVSTNDKDNFTGFRVTSTYSGGTIMRSGVTSVHTDVSPSFSDTATVPQLQRQLQILSHIPCSQINDIDSFTKPRISSKQGGS